MTCLDDFFHNSGSPAQVSRVLIHHSLFKKMPYLLVYWPTWWRQFLNWGSVFSEVPSLRQADKKTKLKPNTYILFCGKNFNTTIKHFYPDSCKMNSFSSFFLFFSWDGVSFCGLNLWSFGFLSVEVRGVNPYTQGEWLPLGKKYLNAINLSSLYW